MKRFLLLFALLDLAIPCHAAQLWSWNTTNTFKSPGFNPTMAATNVFTASDNGTVTTGSGSVWTWDANYFGAEDADHVFVTNFLGAMTRTIRGINSGGGTNIFNTIITTNLTVVSNTIINTNITYVTQISTNTAGLWAITNNLDWIPIGSQHLMEITNVTVRRSALYGGGLFVEGEFTLESWKHATLVPGANHVSMTGYSVLYVDAPSTNCVLQLDGQGVGKLVYIINATNSTFTMPSTNVYDSPSAFQTLRGGVWVPQESGEAIQMIGYTNQIVEAHRFNPLGGDTLHVTNIINGKGRSVIIFGDTNVWITNTYVTINGTNLAVVNPTTPYVPYRNSATNFLDSPWFVSTNRAVSEQYIIVGTNTLTTTASPDHNSYALMSLRDAATGESGINGIKVSGWQTGSGPGATDFETVLWGGTSASLGLTAYDGGGNLYGLWAQATPGQLAELGLNRNGVHRFFASPFMGVGTGDPSPFYFTAVNDWTGYPIFTITNNGSRVFTFGLDGSGNSQVMLGPGTTNALYRNGIDLTYTNGAVDVKFIVLNNLGKGAQLEAQGSSGVLATVDPAGSLVLRANTDQAVLYAGDFYPVTDRALDLGTISYAWKDTWSSNFFTRGFVDGTLTNYFRLKTTVDNTTGIFDLQAKTNDVNAPITGFSFRTNGVELAWPGVTSAAGAPPVDGSVKNLFYKNTSTGVLYINTGTVAVPTWDAL